jgi:hypothetical protein
MPSSLPIDELRSRMEHYLGRVPAREIKDDEPMAIVLAPVEAGISRFIDVDNLPNLNDIPFIPERMRHFSFKYATEYKSNAYWAKDFGVSTRTIDNWLRHEGVRSYIAICRFEQRMFNMAQHVILERNVYKTINKILEHKLTSDTIGPIVSMAKFVYQVITNPGEVPDRAKGTLNLNIGFGEHSNNGSNPYARERNVSPKELEALRVEIEELDIIAEALGKNGDSDE